MSRFYLTGSINVATVADAFDLVGTRLQPGVTRVPAGEPGDRTNWVLTQVDLFLNNPGLDVGDGLTRIRPGAEAMFDTVDYHTVASEPYAVFVDARRRGVLASDSRFLVSIPTPFNAVNSFVDFDSRVEVALAYERTLRRSVATLQELIPPRDLAIQWDLPTELATVEGRFPNPYPDPEAIYAATARRSTCPSSRRGRHRGRRQRAVPALS